MRSIVRVRTSALRLLGTAFSVLAFCTLLVPAAHAAQVALVADAHVSTARASTNFGSVANLYVGGGNSAFLQFDLTSLPAGLNAGQIARATLTVYVNRVNTAGAVSLAPLTTAWSESTVTSATQPTSGAATGSFSATTAGTYATVDVTALV